MVASSPDVPTQVMFEAVPAAGEQVDRRLASATVSGISPGPAGGTVWGLVGVGARLWVVRTWAAAMSVRKLMGRCLGAKYR